jgi:two-component system response regulator AtoC
MRYALCVFHDKSRKLLTNGTKYVKIYHIMKYTLIGNHPSIKKIQELITLVSDTPFNVLLQGETGTGKEVVARLLHGSSSRRDQRFIKVNCAALPLTLLESELFGYSKGAFTGADKDKPGRFELASDGVIFLDEIGDMNLILQAKLLQVLQSGEFSRIGGTEEIKVNTWTISSTNHDLENDMKEGLFREDLYYRLNIIKIELPPLRDRRDDIPLLTEYFIKKYRREQKIREPFTLSDGMRQLFQAYHWPGNVRELSSCILRLMVDNHSEEVFSQLIDNMKEDGLPPPVELFQAPAGENVQPESVSGQSEPERSLKDLKSAAAMYIEKRAISQALDITRWNKVEAAKMLKISYKALFYKMNDYGMRKEKKHLTPKGDNY